LSGACDLHCHALRDYLAIELIRTATIWRHPTTKFTSRLASQQFFHAVVGASGAPLPRLNSQGASQCTRRARTLSRRRESSAVSWVAQCGLVRCTARGQRAAGDRATIVRTECDTLRDAKARTPHPNPLPQGERGWQRKSQFWYARSAIPCAMRKPVPLTLALSHKGRGDGRGSRSSGTHGVRYPTGCERQYPSP